MIIYRTQKQEIMIKCMQEIAYNVTKGFIVCCLL